MLGDAYRAHTRTTSAVRDGEGLVQVEVGRLWQQAILETRDAKREPESLAELRAGWKAEVAAWKKTPSATRKYRRSPTWVPC